MNDATHDVVNMYVQFRSPGRRTMVLPVGIDQTCWVSCVQGRFDNAQEAFAEGRALGEATGAPGSPRTASSIELALLCWRGREEEARDLAARIAAELEHLEGDGRQSYHHRCIYLAVLDLGLGRYRQAYDQALPVFRDDRWERDPRSPRSHRGRGPLR